MTAASAHMTAVTGTKINLVGLSREELEAELESFGLPAFRARQLWHWIYHRGATSFDVMTTIARDMQAKLAERYTIGRPEMSREIGRAHV